MLLIDVITCHLLTWEINFSLSLNRVWAYLEWFLAQKIRCLGTSPDFDAMYQQTRSYKSAPSRGMVSGLHRSGDAPIDHLDPPDLPRHGCNSDRGPAASGGPTVLANDRNGGRLRLNTSRHDDDDDDDDKMLVKNQVLLKGCFTQYHHVTDSQTDGRNCRINILHRIYEWMRKCDKKNPC